MRRPLRPTEAQMQTTLMTWLRAQHDGRRWSIHIPNEGKRSRVAGSVLKKQGLLPGASDILVPIARGGFHGLWFELKAYGKSPTDAQLTFLHAMSEQGYATGWSDDLDSSMYFINRYADGLLLRPNWVHYEAPAVAAMRA